MPNGSLHTSKPELGKVFIGAEIERSDGAFIAAMIHEADAKMKGKGPLTIYINTTGGLVDEGFQIVDTIRFLKREVVTFGQGIVNSMGILILAAGDKRIASPLTTFMTHEFNSEQPKLTMSVISARQDIRQIKYKMYAGYLAERTAQSQEFWESKMQPVDYYFGVKEAKKFGLIHEIMS